MRADVKECDTPSCPNVINDGREFCSECLRQQENELRVYIDEGLAELRSYLRPRGRFCEWLREHGYE